MIAVPEAAAFVAIQAMRNADWSGDFGTVLLTLGAVFIVAVFVIGWRIIR